MDKKMFMIYGIGALVIFVLVKFASNNRNVQVTGAGPQPTSTGGGTGN